MFIGREKELEELVEKINNDRFESILIYGRRRIGKTELIKEATKSANSKVIYYKCKRALLNDNLKDFNSEINNVLLHSTSQLLHFTSFNFITSFQIMK